MYSRYNQMQPGQKLVINPAVITGDAPSPLYPLRMSYVSSAAPDTVFTGFPMRTETATGETYSDTKRLILTLAETATPFTQKPIFIKNLAAKKQAVYIHDTDSTNTALYGATSGAGAAIAGTVCIELLLRFTPITDTYDRATLTWNILNTLGTGTAFTAHVPAAAEITGGVSLNNNLRVAFNGDRSIKGPLTAATIYPAGTTAFTIYGFIVDIKMTGNGNGGTANCNTWGRTISAYFEKTSTTSGTPQYKNSQFFAVYDGNATAT